MRIEVDTDYDSIDVLKQAKQQLDDAIAAKEPKPESSGFMNIFDMPTSSESSSTTEQSASSSGYEQDSFTPTSTSEQTAAPEPEEKPQITIIDY